MGLTTEKHYVSLYKGKMVKAAWPQKEQGQKTGHMVIDLQYGGRIVVTEKDYAQNIRQYCVSVYPTGDTISKEITRLRSHDDPPRLGYER